MEAEKTAAIGINTSSGYEDIQTLRDNLTKQNIKFAENGMPRLYTIINVKYSDFDNASKIITDTGFEILN
jgi:hypothetical protein